jgi:hypothetical protein
MINPITINNKSTDHDFIRYGYFDAILGLGQATVEKLRFNPTNRQRKAYTLGYLQADTMITGLVSKIGLELVNNED